ncbi:MAG: TonB-dependent receptor [Zoogloeaceae bacterium]|jgi:vitamin B12 transporter|nr:TonB-dependent receptor [Zoogloeaceae bacterium]
MKHTVIRAATLALALFSIHITASADEAEIVVTATRQPQRVNELLSDVTVLDRQAIEQTGHSALVELLSGQPGIQISTTGGAGAGGSLFIRGANSSHALVLVDGIRVGSATTGQATLENLPAAQIERIEILRGPASALYGSDAIGGVVQIFTRGGSGAPHADFLAGIGSQQTRRLQAGISGATADDAVRFSLRLGRETTAGIDALSDPTDRDGFRQTHASGRLALKLPNKGELSASFLTANSLSEYDVGLDADTRSRMKGSVAGARWRQPLTENWISTLEAGVSTDSVKAIDSGFDSTVRTRRAQFGWMNDLQLPVGSLLLGVERVNESVSHSATALARTRRHTDSLLAGWTGRFGSHRLQANLRRDASSQFGHQRTGSLAYGYQIDERWRVHAAAGTGFKAPTFNDLYFPLACFPGFGCYGGNPDLRPERARNREAGVNWDAGAQRAGLVIYDNRVKDLIVWGNQPFNVGSARLRGATLSHDWSAGDWEGGASLDWLRARDADTGQQLIRRAPRQLAVRVTRRLGAWRLGGEWLAVSRRYDTDFNTGARVRLGGYGIINAFAHYALQRDWTLELRGNNLGDKHYRHAFQFNTPGASVFAAVRYEPK